MMRFEEVVEQNAPRLVIEYTCGPDKLDRFKWGAVGSLPVLDLICAVLWTQRALLDIGDGKTYLEVCPHRALVIAFDKEQREFSVFLGEDVPVDPLVGMLEVVKTSMILQGPGNTGAPDGIPSLFGPDGKPFGRG